MEKVYEKNVVEIFKISSNLYLRKSDYNRRGQCNSAFIVWDDGVCIVDPSTMEAAQEMLDEIALLIKKPIRSVILTHNHGDHVEGMPMFYPMPINIYCSHRCERELAANNTGPAVVAGVRGSLDLQFGTVKVELRPIEEVTHSPTDMLVRLPDEGVVCTGDFAGDNRILYFSEAHPQNWIANLYQLARGSDKYILPGHGDLYPATKILETAQHLALLREAAIECIDRYLGMQNGLTDVNYDTLDTLLMQYLQEKGEKALKIVECVGDEALRELRQVVRKYAILEPRNDGIYFLRKIS